MSRAANAPFRPPNRTRSAAPVPVVTPCAPGYGGPFGVPPSAPCVICPVGTFSPGATDANPRPSCSACPAGFTNLETGPTSASTCTGDGAPLRRRAFQRRLAAPSHSGAPRSRLCAHASPLCSSRQPDCLAALLRPGLGISLDPADRTHTHLTSKHAAGAAEICARAPGLPPHPALLPHNPTSPRSHHARAAPRSSPRVRAWVRRAGGIRALGPLRHLQPRQLLGRRQRHQPQAAVHRLPRQLDHGGSGRHVSCRLPR